MPSLRDYQQQSVDAVRSAYAKGTKKVLLVSPTGSGKTIMFSYISAGVANKKKRVVILAHRRELLKQISEALIQWRVHHGMLLGGMVGMPSANVIVASVGTLARRIQHFPAPDLIICDEAHHVTPDTMFGKIIGAFPSAHVLGVTATPERLDGTGLDGIFQQMVVGPGVAELTALGYLSPSEVYAPTRPDLSKLHKRGGDYVTAELAQVMDKPTITGDAVNHYRKLAHGKKAVAFCVSIAHAEDVAKEFNAAGYKSASIDGKMDDATRDKTIEAFKRGEIQVLTSCDLISEGFDLPAIECAILLRPTESVGLYLQQVGRAIRPAPGKSKTIIIDHADNTRKHGFIDQPRFWSLSGSKRGNEAVKHRVAPIKTCPKCFAVHAPAPACVRCGYVYAVASREIEYRDGELAQVSSVADYQPESGVDESEKLYRILTNIGRKRGYSNPERWAFSVVSEKLAAKLMKENGFREGTINGLLPDEIEELKSRTMDKARVMKAMSKENPISAGG